MLPYIKWKLKCHFGTIFCNCLAIFVCSSPQSSLSTSSPEHSGMWHTPPTPNWTKGPLPQKARNFLQTHLLPPSLHMYDWPQNIWFWLVIQIFGRVRGQGLNPTSDSGKNNLSRYICMPPRPLSTLQLSILRLKEPSSLLPSSTIWLGNKAQVCPCPAFRSIKERFQNSLCFLKPTAGHRPCEHLTAGLLPTIMKAKWR